ncbi:MAG: helix-turn-helix domain-containing protein [Alphaproteobacteria bacterium]|nr:helix-turn-helix domain-containing protein [Alphaproteobacteria bacterium]
MSLDKTANRLEALGNPTRLNIYRILVRAGPEGLVVGKIQRRAAVPRSTLSHHLHKLIGVGLVTQQRHGTMLVCHANYAVMTAVVDFLTEECCVDSDDQCSEVRRKGAA